MQNFSTKTLVRIAAGVDLTKKKLRGASPGSYQLGPKKVMATNAVDTLANGWLFRKFELRDIDAGTLLLAGHWKLLADISGLLTRLPECAGIVREGLAGTPRAAKSL